MLKEDNAFGFKSLKNNVYTDTYMHAHTQFLMDAHTKRLTLHMHKQLAHAQEHLIKGRVTCYMIKCF